MSDTTASVETIIHPKLVSPYDPENIAEVCQIVLGEYKDCDVIFNIAAGTKIMSIVSFACAQERDAEAIYVIAEGNARIIKWRYNKIQTEPIKVNIPIDVRFACYRFHATCGNGWSPEYCAVAKELADITAVHPET